MGLEGTYAYAAPPIPPDVWPAPAPTFPTPNVPILPHAPDVEVKLDEVRNGEAFRKLTEFLKEAAAKAKAGSGAPPREPLEARLDRIERLLTDICERLSVREAMDELLKRLGDQRK